MANQGNQNKKVAAKNNGNPEEAAAPEGNKPDAVADVKAPGTFSTLYIKTAGKVGLVEHTKLEPDFVDNMKTIEKYRLAVDRIFSACELINQPNKKIIDAGKLNEDNQMLNPHYRVANSLIFFSTYMLTPAEQKEVMLLKAVFEKMRDRQYTMRSHIRKITQQTRCFVTKDNDEMIEMRKTLTSSLLTMDNARQSIKRAATRDELEKCGKEYSGAVNLFNQTVSQILLPKNEAEKVDLICTSYPHLCYMHQRELVKFHMGRKDFHAQMAKTIGDFLAGKFVPDAQPEQKA